MNRVFLAKILDITEEKQKFNYHLANGEWTHDEISLGWFVHLEGSSEKIKVDTNKPDDLKVGDLMRVTMEKV